MRCKDANAAQSWAFRHRMHPDFWPGRKVRYEVVHGTRPMYNRGCRCEPCVVANRNYMREYMRKYLRDQDNLLKHRERSREFMRRQRIKGDLDDKADL